MYLQPTNTKELFRDCEINFQQNIFHLGGKKKIISPPRKLQYIVLSYILNLQLYKQFDFPTLHFAI